VTCPVTKILPTDLPKELVPFFGDPPLIGDETERDYWSFFMPVASAVKPEDNIGWIYTQDVVDLAWQIRRERGVLAAVVKLLQKQVVLHLLKSTFETPESSELALVHAAVYRILTPKMVRSDGPAIQIPRRN
jgi:hypothetical protein